VNPNRFRLALEQLRPAQWERFEQLASAFLVDDYPGLRTTASPSGDGGRDAKLVQPQGDDAVVIQYSVRADWPTKISQTLKAMRKNFPDADQLIYVTNQVIGATADKQLRKIRKDHGVFVDIRDQNWFLERVNTTISREEAAEALAVEIADAFLARKGVIERKPEGLTSQEERAACVYLALQWEDDTREKGLTRICFEALVRSVLRDTDPDHRLSRAQIREHVRAILPAHPEATVDRYTDSALNQLIKRYVRHYRQDDEFCLTYDERKRIASRLADMAAGDQELRGWLRILVDEVSEGVRGIPIDAEALVDGTKLTLDNALWRRGETFAAAVHRGVIDLEFPELHDIARSVAREIGPNRATIDSRIAGVLTDAAGAALTESGVEMQRYLRSLADSYTLFAFMRETPDVQSAVVKMFSAGDIWLDTTVVLPLFAEELAVDSTARLYSNLLAAARECGLNLYVTYGVLEEIAAHMRRCVAFSYKGTDRWEGRVPFLAAAFALTGRARGAIPSWLTRFRGNERPEDDIAQYLAAQYGIGVSDLEDEASKASIELRGAVKEIWHEAHERRRNRGVFVGDIDTTARLVDHDVENYLGVVRRRRRDRDSPFGYTTWWLTLDRVAHNIPRELKKTMKASEVPSSPVITPDFMANFLAIGPVRNRIAKSTEGTLPLSIAALKPLDLMPKALLDAAETQRESMKDMPEHVIQREVRDSLDRGRRRRGPLLEGGIDFVMEELAGAMSMEQ
jgi:hypothetical protein